MKWKTKNGKSFELGEMNDLHLTNAIRLTRNNLKNLKLSGKPTGQQQSALEQLLKERLKRDTYAFSEDFDVAREYVKPLSFMEALREL